jgi:aspartyl-tRNA(Asn)/glutamyl-tRNA(Gln) amidotransferase subunit A
MGSARQAGFMRTIEDHVQALQAGRTTARAIVETCLSRIGEGEGRRAFVKVYADQARAMADAMDALRRGGRAPSRYAGIPFSVKDLFDVAGEPTPAGSLALADAASADATATVVARMLAQGFIPLGRTNMTEFAFSGLGINPHHDTPRGPWDRETGRIPGGSSSGAAVSVADGMALGALGTDTGGSCRIPAALCGIVGFKPTARRVPMAGVLPLSPSLDSVGPLAPSVACAAVVDAVLAGETPVAITPFALAGLRLALPDNFMLEGMDDIVGTAFERALTTLRDAGVVIARVGFAEFDDFLRVNTGGGFSAAESYAWHRRLIAEKGPIYDPLILKRIARGEHQSAADYIDLLTARRRLIASFNVHTAGYDALIMPTVPVVPPKISDLTEEAEFSRVNSLLLRNNAVGNFLDRCAISLPIHRHGEAPVGLMLMGETMGDARLFAIAAAVEKAIPR